MIAAASKYGAVRREQRRRQTFGRPTIWVPTVSGAAQRLADWYWRELKEGGFLFEYLHAERRRTPRMIRQVARMMDGFTQNPRSDLRRLAAVPARLYHRWKREDPNFWEDDGNLRSLKRDNPDLPIYVGPTRVRGTRYRYGHCPNRPATAATTTCAE